MERDILLNQQDVSSAQMINDRERQLSKLSERMEKVTEQNLQLKRQLQRVTRDNDMLKRKLHDDPLYNIFAQSPSHPSTDLTHTFSSYQTLQQRLSIYHQQLQTNARQILLLRNKLTQRQRMIIDQQQKILSNNQYKMDLQRENRVLKVQLENMNGQVISYRNVVEMFQEKLNHEKYVMENLKEDIEKQNRQDNHQIIKVSNQFASIAKDWSNISQHVLKKIKQPTRQSLSQAQLKEINNRQKLIMEDLGREMDQRNQIINQLKEEIIRLKAQNQQGIEYYAQRHTMVEMINNSKTIEEKYKQMVEKFKHMVEALAKSVDEKEQLRKQYQAVKAELENFNAQREEIKALKTEYENYKNLYQSTSQSLRFLEENMVQVLTENEALHNFMYKSRGSKVYMQAIAEQLRKYEIQQKERQKEYKWANVTELINMNIKLTNRIRQKS